MVRRRWVPGDSQPTWAELVSGTIIGRAMAALATQLASERSHDLIAGVSNTLREQVRRAASAMERSITVSILLLIAFELIRHGAAGEVDSVVGVQLSPRVALVAIPILAGGLVIRLGQASVDANNFYVALTGFHEGLGGPWRQPSVQVPLSGVPGFNVVGDNEWMEALPYQHNLRWRFARLTSIISYIGCTIGIPLWALSAAVRVAVGENGALQGWAVVASCWVALAWALGLATYATYASLPFWSFHHVRSVSVATGTAGPDAAEVLPTRARKES